MSSTFEEYKARRKERLEKGVDVEKLRLGQAACEIVTLPSDSEVRFALVPLTEGEYRRSLEVAEKLDVGDGMSGALVREQVQKEMILFFAAREIRDLNKHFFNNEGDISELEHIDVAHAYDIYLEMTAAISPSMMGLSEEDFLPIKMQLPKISWSDLSGPQWYAAQRFLNLIQPLLLTAEYSGSPATLKSTE